VNNVDKEPIIIPISNAIKMVPAPTPRLLMCDRSAVQANRVGLEIPVAKPNAIPEAIKASLEFTCDIRSIDPKRINVPISIVSRRPIRSEREEVNSLTTIVEIT